MTDNNIPLFNLVQQHAELRDEINKEVIEALDSMKWLLGPKTAEFEKEFAQAIGAKESIACSSGASAIQIALTACGLEEGDEVITTPFTFLATTSSITLAKGKIVFADVDPETANISPKEIEKKITPKTKAILPVHLFGLPAEMDAIMEIAKKHNLKVIEDCAQSHLSKYKGITTGAIGDAGAFSFYPSKNLGACGDAGAITTNDATVALNCQSLRHSGRKIGHAYEYQFEGSTLRMDEIQAALLRVKLKRLEDWTQKRRKIATVYDKLLENSPVRIPPHTGADGSQSYYVYTIKAPKRDGLSAYLKERGIGNAVYYPTALYNQPVYKYMNLTDKDFPATAKLTTEVLSIPMFPELSEEQAERVCTTIKNFYSKK